MNLSPRLLRPRSIAVYGGRFAELVIRQCEHMDYDGDIWPVNPKRDQICGYPCLRSSADLPRVPDAAFIGVNRYQTVDVVKQLAAIGAGGAVAYASGFKETDAEGERLQRALIDAAGTMPVIGPNCFGFINYLDGALLWPDVHGGKRVPRGVALLTQSSNIGINLTMGTRGLPVAYLVALGNQAMVDPADVISALVKDRRVTAIGIYIEGIADASSFSRSVAAARERGIPIVALKAGRSQTAADLAMSHTASLTGSDAVMDAYLKRIGVPRVQSIPALLETLKLLHLHRPLTGADIVSLSCSGGEASIMSDTAVDRRLTFRPFSDSEKQRVQATVNPLVTVSNPFDYHTFDWGKPERLLATFTAVMQCNFDLTLLVLDFPNQRAGIPHEWHQTWRALAQAAAATGRPAAIVATLPECLPESLCDQLIAAGLIPFLTIDDALTAIETAAFIGQCQPVAVAAHTVPASGHSYSLSEYDAKQLLAEFGVPVPRGYLCACADEAAGQARRIGAAVAVKASSAALAHKVEAGGVVLNLTDEGEIRATYRRLSSIGDAVLVETMVADGLAELIIGAARDPVVGLYLMIGAGGTLTEVLADTAILLLPCNEAQARRAILELKIAPTLTGGRGRPGADIDAAVQVVMAVQRLVSVHADSLLELDINPLILRSQGDGVVAVDALIKFANQED